MSGFGGGHGKGNCLIVPHFAYEYNVRVFTERASQSAAERFNVPAYLTLMNSRFVLNVPVLDRVFYSDYVTGAASVDMVNYRRKGSGFSGTCRTRYKDKSALFLGKLRKYGRHFQLIQGRYLFIEKSY